PLIHILPDALPSLLICEIDSPKQSMQQAIPQLERHSLPKSLDHPQPPGYKYSQPPGPCLPRHLSFPPLFFSMRKTELPNDLSWRRHLIVDNWDEGRKSFAS